MLVMLLSSPLDQLPSVLARIEFPGNSPIPRKSEPKSRSGADGTALAPFFSSPKIVATTSNQTSRLGRIQWMFSL